MDGRRTRIGPPLNLVPCKQSQRTQTLEDGRIVRITLDIEVPENGIVKPLL